MSAYVFVLVKTHKFALFCLLRARSCVCPILQAFGGVETFKYAYSNTTTSHAVTRSAFMLFYDRVPVEPAQGPSDAAPALLLERTPSGTGVRVCARVCVLSSWL